MSYDFGCPVIDVHYHFGRKTGYGTTDEYSAEQAIGDMDRHGVTQSVISHFVSQLRTADDFAAANALVARAVEAHPDRLVGGIVASPYFEPIALRDIKEHAEAGFRLVKLHPLHHGRYKANGGIVDPIVAMAADYGLAVLVHSDAISPECSPLEVAALAKRFPTVAFIVAHLGLHPDYIGWAVEAVADTPNVYVDTAQTPDFPTEVYARSCQVLGSDRVLFGTDGPECSVDLNLRKIELAIEAGLPAGDARKVLGENARQLLELTL